MKKGLALLMSLFLLACCFTAQADIYDAVWIKSATSDRVHLRQQANSNAKSLGLYFTGTRAVILEESREWTYVMIGTEKGYVHNTLLSAKPVNAQSRVGTVTANGSLNLRAYPSKSASILTKIPEGTAITLLGETHDHWYLVKTNDTYGYVMTSYVKTAGTADDGVYTPSVPAQLKGRWYYSSGAGGWQTVMTIDDDGTFWGYYHDSEMGDIGKNYPYGSAYECLFTGRFVNIRQVNAHEYQMEVEGYHFFGENNEEKILNKIRYITVDTAGMAQGTRCSLYTSGFSTSALNENALFQYQNYATQGNPAFFYNHNTEAGFIAD